VYPLLRGKRGEELLREISDKWQKHEVFIKWMTRFFQYLDRFYIKQNSLTGLADQGYIIFKTIVFQPLLEHIIDAFAHQIK